MWYIHYLDAPSVRLPLPRTRTHNTPTKTALILATIILKTILTLVNLIPTAATNAAENQNENNNHHQNNNAGYDNHALAGKSAPADVYATAGQLRVQKVGGVVAFVEPQGACEGGLRYQGVDLVWGPNVLQVWMGSGAQESLRHGDPGIHRLRRVQ